MRIPIYWTLTFFISQIFTIISAASARAERHSCNAIIPKVRFYQHGGGGGKVFEATDCNTPTRHLSKICLHKRTFPKGCDPSWNDRISSVRSDTMVVLWEDADYKGKCLAIQTNGKVANLSSYGFNDVVSSFKVKSPAPSECRLVILRR